MALNYPSTQFYGVDIFAVFPAETRPKNVKFVKIDSFTKGYPFSDNYFDYIRISLVGNLLKKREWPIVLDNLLK